MALLSSRGILAGAIALLFLTLFVPPAFGQASMTVTVSTDKPQYLPGETVTIYGKLTDSQGNPVNGASVSIEVNDPPIYIQLVSSNQSGTYSNQFSLSNSFAAGSYMIFVTASMGNLTAAAETQFTVVEQTASTATSSSVSSTTQPAPTSQCFIATATYGSALAPQVVLLRTFRDNEILRTSAGSEFMLAFNAFYYSFSPEAASYIASNQALRDVMEMLLYPLIGILYLASRIFAILSYNGEIAVTAAGIFAATCIGIVYLGPFLLSLRRLRTAKVKLRTSIVPTACLLSLTSLAFGEVLKASVLLSIAAVAVVLTFVSLGGLCAVYLVYLHERRSICPSGRVQVSV